MRVPYRWIFLKRDGRPDRQPERRLEGARGIWATYGGDMTWHIEGGAGTKNKVLKIPASPESAR